MTAVCQLTDTLDFVSQTCAVYVGWRARVDERKILHSEYANDKTCFMDYHTDSCTTSSHATSAHKVEVGNQM